MGYHQFLYIENDKKNIVDVCEFLFYISIYLSIYHYLAAKRYLLNNCGEESKQVFVSIIASQPTSYKQLAMHNLNSCGSSQCLTTHCRHIRLSHISYNYTWYKINCQLKQHFIKKKFMLYNAYIQDSVRLRQSLGRSRRLRLSKVTKRQGQNRLGTERCGHLDQLGLDVIP